MAARKAVNVQRRNSSAVKAVSSMEVMQIAGEAGFIGGVAGVMVAITLVVSLLSMICIFSDDSLRLLSKRYKNVGLSSALF